MVSPIAGLYQDVAGSCNFNFELHTPFLFFFIFIFLRDFIFKKIINTIITLRFFKLQRPLDWMSPRFQWTTSQQIENFYQEPCGRKLKSSIENPVNKQQPLYLLFDAVNKFKNICNNFLSKRHFNNFPPFMNVNAGNPFFPHIERAYRMEISQPFKITHQLSQKAFHPTNIKRTNFKLADAIFSWINNKCFEILWRQRLPIISWYCKFIDNNA